MEFGTYFNKKETLSPEIVLALSVFNSITVPSPTYSNDKIYFEATDLILRSSQQLHSIKTIRSGSLVWYPYPSKSLNSSNIEEVVYNYITSTVTRYPGIRYWDVLNEAFLESGYLRIQSSLGRVNPISRIPNWVEKIFIWAHQANPTAKLFVNDYRPQNSLKWSGVFALVDSLLEKGVPIHGIGIQHHHHLPRCIVDGLFAWGATRKVCRKAKERGLIVHFTETSLWNNPDNLYVQALAYRQLVQCAIDEGVEHFNIWSPFDCENWHWKFSENDKEAGLYDSNLLPKPAYWALKGLMF